MNLTAKVFLSIAAIQFGFVPPIVDFTETHVFHPDWPPHARFHLVWLLALGTVIASYVLATIWLRPAAIRHASIIGCIVLSTFFLAALFSSLYGGSLSDMAEPIRILGIDGNVFSFSIASILQVCGTTIVWRDTRQEGT